MYSFKVVPIIFVLLFFVLSHFAFASDLDQAKKKFHSYQLEESLELLNNLIDDKNTNKQVKNEALLYKIYILSNEKTIKNLGPNLNLLINNFDDPNPYIFSLMSFLWGNVSVGSADEETVELMEDLINSDKINELVRPHFYEAVGKYKFIKNDFDEFKENLEKVNNIVDWQFVGEFDNISGFGFKNGYPPINNPSPDATFKNKWGADISWYDVKGIEKGEWVDYTYFFSGQNSIVYAQNFYYSETKKEVIATIGVSGSVKVWTNDRLVFSEENERNNGLDSYKFKIHLEKGWNRLLIQSGESEASRLNFSFRLLDKNFKPLKNEKVSKKYQKYKKLSGEKIELVEDETEKYFQQKIKNNPSKNIYKYFLYEYYLFLNFTDKARLLMDEIDEANPDSKFNILKKINLYSLLGKRTLISQEVEKVRKFDDFPMNLELLWNDALEVKDLTKMDSLLIEMEKLEFYFPKENIYEKQLSILSLKENWEALFNLAQKAYDKYPNNPKIMNLMFVFESKGNNDLEQAEEILKDYLEDNNFTNTQILLSSFYLENAELEKANQVYQDLIEQKKYSTGVYEKLASNYFVNRNYEKSLEYINKAIEYAPFYSQYRSRKGDIYNQMDKKDLALKSYNKALSLYPLDYSIRDKIRFLEGKKTIFEQLGEPDMDSKFLISAGKNEFPEDNLLVLHDEVKSVAYKNGGFEQKFYLLYKILTKSGIDLVKEYTIPVYNNQNFLIEKANVLKSDGNVIKAEQNKNQLVFTNLEEGDGVLLIYTLQTYQSSLLVEHFWDDFYFNSYFPTMFSKYSLAVEDDKKFEYKMLNNKIELTVSDFENFKVYSWERGDNPKIEDESYMPRLQDVADMLFISSINNWSEISDWYKKLSDSKAKVDYDVNKLYEEIFTKEKSNLNKLDKAKEIYQYIVKSIRYSSVSFRQSGLVPQKASDLVNEKIGDCKDVSTLFVALCKKAGLDANLVLVNTRRNGLNAMSLPSINFDHCIAELNLDNEKYYLELTAENLPFGTIGENMINSFSLPIHNNSTKPINLDFKKRLENKISRNTEISFQGNKAIIKKNTIKIGSNASLMRSSYLYSSKKERFESMQEAIIDDNPTLKLTKFEFNEGLDKVNTPVKYYVEYEDLNPFVEISSMSLYLFKIPWTDNFSNLEIISQPNRQHTLELWRYFTSEKRQEKIIINLPNDKKLSGFPENINISNEVFDYQLNFKQNGNKIECNRNFKIKIRDVNPNYYNKFKTDFEKVIKSDKLNIELLEKNN